MEKYTKKPIMVNLVATLIMCLVTFIIGFSISSFVLLDSRIESAQEKISDLNAKLDEKNAEIKELNKTIDQKNENNVTLAEKIQDQAAVIEKLNSNVSSLEKDVASISEAAINSSDTAGGTAINSFARLSLTQQLILFVILLVLLIFIVSVTCAIIAVKSPSKGDKPKENKAESDLDLPSPEPEEEAQENAEDELNPPSLPDSEISGELAPEISAENSFIPAVAEAIDLLYHNNLEDSISELGGFKFGITNFDEILSDKSKGKAFGNCENGDFVAFMSSAASVRKLYIIPRYLTLSDSTVALRGTTDLFNITDEGGNKVTNGTVRINSINSPAVFACGENGWAIESKGTISALGNKTI